MATLRANPSPRSRGRVPHPGPEEKARTPALREKPASRSRGTPQSRRLSHASGSSVPRVPSLSRLRPGKQRWLQSAGPLLGGAGDIGHSHGGGGAGPGGGAAAGDRGRRARAAARGRRGAHPAAVPAGPGADAGAGASRRGAQRLHVVLDPLAILAQLGHGSGTLPVSRRFGLDGRGARHPSGRCGVAAQRYGSRRPSSHGPERGPGAALGTVPGWSRCRSSPVQGKRACLLRYSRPGPHCSLPPHSVSAA